jgi:hypothetical protein
MMRGADGPFLNMYSTTAVNGYLLGFKGLTRWKGEIANKTQPYAAILVSYLDRHLMLNKTKDHNLLN